VDDDSTAVDDDSTAVVDASTAVDDASHAVDDDPHAVDDDSHAVDMASLPQKLSLILGKGGARLAAPIPTTVMSRLTALAINQPHGWHAGRRRDVAAPQVQLAAEAIAAAILGQENGASAQNRAPTPVAGSGGQAGV